mgnify:CR=1
YAEMDDKDPRLKAVRTWLKENYSIAENPGMGPQGLYYYYRTMAKALSLSGIEHILDKNGTDLVLSPLGKLRVETRVSNSLAKRGAFFLKPSS